MANSLHDELVKEIATVVDPGIMAISRLSDIALGAPQTVKMIVEGKIEIGLSKVAKIKAAIRGARDGDEDEPVYSVPFDLDPYDDETEAYLAAFEWVRSGRGRKKASNIETGEPDGQDAR